MQNKFDKIRIEISRSIADPNIPIFSQNHILKIAKFLSEETQFSFKKNIKISYFEGLKS